MRNYVAYNRFYKLPFFTFIVGYIRLRSKTANTRILWYYGVTNHVCKILHLAYVKQLDDIM